MKQSRRSKGEGRKEGRRDPGREELDAEEWGLSELKKSLEKAGPEPLAVDGLLSVSDHSPHPLLLLQVFL